jgi:hypothetical protein
MTPNGSHNSVAVVGFPQEEGGAAGPESLP